MAWAFVRDKSAERIVVGAAANVLSMGFNVRAFFFGCDATWKIVILWI
jgi:hypothetical protein